MMRAMKRFWSGLAWGIVMGVICWALGRYVLNLPLGIQNFVAIVLNRMILGIVIALGISLPGVWWRKASLLGLVAGLPLTYADAMAGFGLFAVVAVTFMSLLYGVVIAWLLDRGTPAQK